MFKCVISRCAEPIGTQYVFFSVYLMLLTENRAKVKLPLTMMFGLNLSAVTVISTPLSDNLEFRASTEPWESIRKGKPSATNCL